MIREASKKGTIHPISISTDNEIRDFLGSENSEYPMPGQLIDLNIDHHFLCLIDRLAKNHSILRQTDIQIRSGPDLLEEYTGALQKMSAMKRRANSKPKLSDFDVLFLKNYNNYINDIQRAYDMLQNTAYSQFRETALSQNSICHNNLKKDAIIFSCNSAYISNFFHATNDYYLVDLSNIILRYLKYNGSPVPMSQVLDTYNTHNPLHKHELEILYVMLMYPGSFIKTCMRYYEKHRSYLPQNILRSLNTALDKRDFLLKYIEDISYSSLI